MKIETEDWESELLELADLSFGSKFVGQYSKQFSAYEVRIIKLIKNLLTSNFNKGHQPKDEEYPPLADNSKIGL